jgi:hypothetical protein
LLPWRRNAAACPRAESGSNYLLNLTFQIIAITLVCSAPFMCGAQTGLPAVAPHPFLRGPVTFAGGARWSDIHGALAPGYVIEWPYTWWADGNGTLRNSIPPGLLAQCQLRRANATEAGARWMWDPFAQRVRPLGLAPHCPLFESCHIFRPPTPRPARTRLPFARVGDAGRAVGR